MDIDSGSGSGSESDRDEEAPQVVVLKKGDLTAEEAEQEQKRIETGKKLVRKHQTKKMLDGPPNKNHFINCSYDFGFDQCMYVRKRNEKKITGSTVQSFLLRCSQHTSTLTVNSLIRCAHTHTIYIYE